MPVERRPPLGAHVSTAGGLPRAADGCEAIQVFVKSPGRDRHANLGEGRIGLALFERLLSEPRFRRVPVIIETPDRDGRGHERDLGILRGLRDSSP